MIDQGEVCEEEASYDYDDCKSGQSGDSGNNNLEAVLKQMRDAAATKNLLEEQHAKAVAQLRIQQRGGGGQESVEQIQSRIRELERKTELQNMRHEELLLEMAAIKRTGPGSYSQVRSRDH